MGIDPGLQGALAIYDDKTRRLVEVRDMPVYTIHGIKKANRTRVDGWQLLEYFELAKLMGVELVLLEEVGGRPKQSAQHAFTFGYSVGLIYMACLSARIPIETVSAATWKLQMKLPGKTQANADARILERTLTVFPDDATMFYGVRGGVRIDRCEAAMLAKFCADRVLDGGRMRVRKYGLDDGELYRAALLD